ncbi:MAG TPA: glycine betaine ABC transporter substrate-binding protein [Gemmataceae bacterium]|jgi:osmoprotectant transport system permease protein|nr:glycine betaine ABC transporter substrate-binding protein [Gemmataceae bacterium]
MRTPLNRWAALLLLVVAPVSVVAEPIRIGSKSDTETTVLAHVVADLVRDAGNTVDIHERYGGTQVVWGALRVNSLDVYPEYTGTLYKQIFADRNITSDAALREELARLGLGMTRPLGFANNYALGMKRARAMELGIKNTSDLRNHPKLRLGFSNEFLKRADGWPGLQAAYALPHNDARGMDHRLAYKALDEGGIDVTELYTTDAEIKKFDLVTLTDDRSFFPEYQAVLVYRLDLETRAPSAVAAFKRLEGKLSANDVIEMNSRAMDGDKPAVIAADFVRKHFQIETTVVGESDAHRLWRLTVEHLMLVGIALAASILVALPLGILSARRPTLGRFLIGTAGVIQTIPSLALLVFMIPILHTGTIPAIVALFLYALLPIMANTAAGLRGIPTSIAESAEALGLSASFRLWRIDLPLASRSILAGIKTSAIITIGTATLGALIGAGGYGQPIQAGLQNVDRGEILFGAIPAAVMALVAQGLFEVAERVLVPRGLRLTPSM